MEKILVFISNHWELVVAFIVVLLIFIANEVYGKIYGTPKVTPQQATDLLNHQDAIVVDLRDPDLFKAGHVIGAKNIPIKTLQENHNKLEPYKDKPIVLVCNQGQQSALAAKVLKKEGYQNVVILGNGINAWRSSNLPLTQK